jgi:hypothetical protein
LWLAQRLKTETQLRSATGRSTKRAWNIKYSHFKTQIRCKDEEFPTSIPRELINLLNLSTRRRKQFQLYPTFELSAQRTRTRETFHAILVTIRHAARATNCPKKILKFPRSRPKHTLLPVETSFRFFGGKLVNCAIKSGVTVAEEKPQRLGHE